ncbi:hypothetical protein [Rossellomorea aquimaris]|uniref:Uncharacterized protein n=1 Tax=Rossellomorea aquimaris TaxID=189382 RepID=A0A5D4TP27_9BACI|nr:hypothetical protein [Rossellomorea aquimaris]TYS76995.1 hypothetical protein FZC80_14210 [Rossellomorea aquimaris]
MRVFFYPPYFPPFIPPHIYKYYFLQKFLDIDKIKQKYPYYQLPAGPYIVGEYLPSGSTTPTGPTTPAYVRPLG